MATTLPPRAAGFGGAAAVPMKIWARRPPADTLFRTLVGLAAACTLAILALIAYFLFQRAWPVFHALGPRFFTTFEWNPEARPAAIGIGSVLFGTVLSSAIALSIALPVAVGTALFVNEYVPVRVGRPLTTLVDLLAAIPSLVFGMWGLYFLQPRLGGLSLWLTTHLGFVPLFHTDRPVFGSSIFVVSIVLGLMILPIVTSVSREVFAQVPRELCEAALALGGTRWAMIRQVMLPFGRSGVIGGAMLGLGRALGETIAVALILSFDYQVSAQILRPGGGSIAGLIALKFGEASLFERNGLMAAGLVLFILTLLVNMAARLVVNRAARLKQAVA